MALVGKPYMLGQTSKETRERAIPLTDRLWVDSYPVAWHLVVPSFRSLPEPLMTFDLHPEFMQAASKFPQFYFIYILHHVYHRRLFNLRIFKNVWRYFWCKMDQERTEWNVSNPIQNASLISRILYQKSGYSNDVRRRIWVASHVGLKFLSRDATQTRRLISFE